MNVTVINEALCYLQNNYGRHPKNVIRNDMIEFYDDDDTAAAKQTLF